MKFTLDSGVIFEFLVHQFMPRDGVRKAIVSFYKEVHGRYVVCITFYHGN